MCLWNSDSPIKVRPKRGQPGPNKQTTRPFWNWRKFQFKTIFFYQVWQSRTLFKNNLTPSLPIMSDICLKHFFVLKITMIHVLKDLFTSNTDVKYESLVSMHSEFMYMYKQKCMPLWSNYQSCSNGRMHTKWEGSMSNSLNVTARRVKLFSWSRSRPKVNVLGFIWWF